MKRFIRLAFFGVVGLALVLCGGIALLNRNAPRLAATALPVVVAPTLVEIDPTAVPAPTIAAAPEPTTIPRGYVSKVLMGTTWPLSIDEGVIVCDRTAILLRAPDDHLYAVNGTARGQIGKFGWLDIRDITLPDPNIKGLIMSVQPIIDQGLDLCR